MADRLSRPVLEGWSVSGVIVHPDDREVPVAVSAGTLRDQDGQVNGAVFVLRDMRRDFELERMKTEFLATISHGCAPAHPDQGVRRRSSPPATSPASRRGLRGRDRPPPPTSSSASSGSS